MQRNYLLILESDTLTIKEQILTFPECFSPHFFVVLHD